MRTRPPQLLRLAVSTALVLSAAACGSSSKSTSPPTQAPPARLTSVTFGTEPSVAALSTYVALDEGIFKKNGLDVTIKKNFAIGTIPAAVVSGQYQFGGSVQAILLAAAAKGLPLVATAGGEVESTGSSNDAVFAGKDTGITRAKELVGKTVGVVSLTGSTATCLWYLLKGDGVDVTPGQLPVKQVVVPFPDMADQVAAGRVSAASAVTPYWQAMLKVGDKYLGDPCLAVSKNGEGSFFISSKSWALSHKPIIAAVDKSLNEANAFIQSNVAASKKILSSYSGLSLPLLADVKLPQFKGSESVADLQTWLTALKNSGYFSGNVDPASLVVGGS